MKPPPADLPARGRWGWCLQLLPPATVRELGAALRGDLDLEPGDLPRAGQHPLTMIDSLAGTPFQLGDLPLATAAVRALDPVSGATSDGAALVMQADAELAEAIALIDAVLAGSLPGSDQAAELVRHGARLADEQVAQDQRLLQATAVQFDLLGVARDETPEDPA